MHVHRHSSAQIDLALITGSVADGQAAGDLFTKHLLQQACPRPLLQRSGRRGALFVRRGHHHFPKPVEFGTVIPSVQTYTSKSRRKAALTTAGSGCRVSCACLSWSSSIRDRGPIAEIRTMRDVSPEFWVRQATYWPQLVPMRWLKEPSGYESWSRFCLEHLEVLLAKAGG